MGGRYTVDTPIEGAAAANTSWVVLGYMWGVLLQLAWLQGDAELYVVLGYKVLQLDMWWVLLGYREPQLQYIWWVVLGYRELQLHMVGVSLAT